MRRSHTHSPLRDALTRGCCAVGWLLILHPSTAATATPPASSGEATMQENESPTVFPKVAVCLRGLGGARDVFHRWREHVFPAFGGDPDVYLVTSMSRKQLEEEFSARIQCPPNKNEPRAHYRSTWASSTGPRPPKRIGATTKKVDPTKQKSSPHETQRTAFLEACSTTGDAAGTDEGFVYLKDALLVPEWEENLSERFFDRESPGWRGIHLEYMWREDSQLWGALPMPLETREMTNAEKWHFQYRFAKTKTSKNNRRTNKAVVNSAATTVVHKPDGRAYFINAHSMQLHDMWRCAEILRDHERYSRSGVEYEHVVLSRLDVTFFAPHANLLGLQQLHPSSPPILQKSETAGRAAGKNTKNTISRALTFQNLGYDYEQPRAKILRPYKYGCFIPTGWDWTQGLTDIFSVCSRQAAEVYLGQPALVQRWIQNGIRRRGIYNPEMLLRDTLHHFGVPVQRYDAGIFRSCYDQQPLTQEPNAASTVVAGAAAAAAAHPRPPLEDGALLGSATALYDKGTNYAARCRYLRKVNAYGKFERPPKTRKPLDHSVARYSDLFSATTSEDSIDAAFQYFRAKVELYANYKIQPFYVSTARHDIHRAHRHYTRNNTAAPGMIGYTDVEIGTSSDTHRAGPPGRVGEDGVPAEVVKQAPTSRVDDATMNNTEIFSENGSELMSPAGTGTTQKNAVDLEDPKWVQHWRRYEHDSWHGPCRDGQQLMSVYHRNVAELDAKRVLWAKADLRHYAATREAENALALAAAGGRVEDADHGILGGGQSASNIVSTSATTNGADSISSATEKAGEQLQLEDEDLNSHVYYEGVYEVHHTNEKMIVDHLKKLDPVLRLLETNHPEKQWPGHRNGDFGVGVDGYLVQREAMTKDSSRRAVAFCQTAKEEETAIMYQLRELSDNLNHYYHHYMDQVPSKVSHFLETVFPYFDLSRVDFGSQG
ncbi:unnamed protein product [Amoebophrya sp. A120]|nr:unnamed protein product [Amoebophrya sp. A120]|eukprot:GSA120T00025787001.1